MWKCVQVCYSPRTPHCCCFCFCFPRQVFWMYPWLSWNLLLDQIANDAVFKNAKMLVWKRFSNVIFFKNKTLSYRNKSWILICKGWSVLRDSLVLLMSRHGISITFSSAHMTSSVYDIMFHCVSERISLRATCMDFHQHIKMWFSGCLSCEVFLSGRERGYNWVLDHQPRGRAENSGFHKRHTDSLQQPLPVRDCHES